MRRLLWHAPLLVGIASAAFGGEPIKLLPSNPRYFLFDGRPTVLITSGEHYGAVLNLDFDFVPYLDEIKSRGFNLTRTFSGTYREVPGSFKIKANTLAPKPGRFVGPYERSSTPGAADGGAKFDLDRWSTAYFDRLRAFCRAAEVRGIVVEFVLFCPFYAEPLWLVNAWHPSNNINESPAIPSKEVYTLTHKSMLDRQKSFVRKVVAELNEFPNLYYEICNEPYFGGVTLDWQAEIAATIVSAEASLKNKHMIAQNIANGSAKIERPNPAVSLFNFHYARPPKAIAMNAHLNKAIGDDETGFQGTGDFVYRAEAWEFMIAGGSLFSHLDYSFTIDHEAGTAPVEEPTPGGGGPAFRSQLAYLKRLLESFEFIRMQPDDAVILGGLPKGTVARALVSKGNAYLIYLKGGSKAVIELDLPAGTYRATWHNPREAKVESESTITSPGGRVVIEGPSYRDDVALSLKVQPARR